MADDEVKGLGANVTVPELGSYEHPADVLIAQFAATVKRVQHAADSRHVTLDWDTLSVLIGQGQGPKSLMRTPLTLIRVSVQEKS